MMFTKFQKKRASSRWCARQKNQTKSKQNKQFTSYYINMTDNDKRKSTRKVEEKDK